MKIKIIAMAVTWVWMSAAHAENIIKMSAPVAQGNPWKPYASLVSDWANDGASEHCSAFSPPESAIEAGVSFVQTVSGCNQKQVQETTKRQINARTQEIRNVSTTQSTRVLDNYSYTRPAIGVDLVWLSEPPLYSAWTNVGASTGCTGYAPAVNTVIEGEAFTQTVSGCTQQQLQTITTQEKHKYTGQTRPTGSSLTNRTLTDYTYTVSAIGTKSAVSCMAFNNKIASQYMWWQEIRNTPSSPSNYGYELMWAGTYIYNNTNIENTRPTQTSFTIGGYKYTRGVFDSTSGYYPERNLNRIVYGVCREKL